MAHAIEKFFPEIEIDVDNDKIDAQRLSTSSRDERPYPLKRISTRNSIVGSDNGDRPGGFVLVIDGAALADVSWKLYL
jgi:phospholipid-translocating ATPase